MPPEKKWLRGWFLVFLPLLLFTSPCFLWGADLAAEEAASQVEPETAPAPVYYIYTAIDSRSEIIIQSDGLLREHRSFSLDNPPRLVVDLQDMTLPVSPVLKVVDRPELLRIRAARRGSQVRFVFDLPTERLVDYQVEREAEGLKVVIQPQAAAEKTAKVPDVQKSPVAGGEPVVSPALDNHQSISIKSYQGKKISVKLFQADISEFFSEITRQTGEVFTLAPEVEGKISLRLTAIPWDQAIDQVLGYYHLQMLAADDGTSWLIVRKKQP
jgi:hypothetical protein